MNRLLRTVLVTLTASSLVGVGQTTASAHPVPHDATRRALTCVTGVVGVDSTRHVTSMSFTNESLTTSIRSTEPLGFDVTAWGYYDREGTERKNALRLNVVASDGRPRNVTITRTKKALRIGRIERYQQRSFTPRLFADGGTFYAYTVDGGTLKRWTLTRFADGSRKFVRPVKVARGFGDATSLQAASVGKVRGTSSEILYATTESGRLLQVVVPTERPGRARVRTLATSGYEGVSELAWSICNESFDHHSLIAIAPAANRATWTTIKHAAGRPKATLRGDLLGVADWNLGAAFRAAP